MLAHFPLALLPAAFVADLVGRLTGNPTLMRVGERLMPFAAASGVATAAAGLAAQEAVDVRDAHEELITHRNLNAGLVGLTALLAVTRRGKPAPGLGYLLASAGTIAGMVYTGYLGGKMVYQYGVGVEPAGGVRRDASPEIHYNNLGETSRLAADHVQHAARHAVHHLREGEIAPTLRSK